jgi:hypothetical protein
MFEAWGRFVYRRYGIREESRPPEPGLEPVGA